MAALAVNPVIGNVVGAIVAYPVTYLMSMRFVWKPDGAVPTKNPPHASSEAADEEGRPPIAPIPSIVFLASLYAIGRITQRRERWKLAGRTRAIRAYVLEEGLARRKVN